MTTASVLDTVVSESQTFVDFVIRLDAPSASNVTMSYQTFAQTAGANANPDYVNATGTLTFLPGEFIKSVRVDLVNDATVEVFETFGFQIFGIAGAALGKSHAIATIADNDAPVGTPVVTVADLVVDEIAGQATFAAAGFAGQQHG